jgi:energy-coupling factor transport system substrate-specific component
MYDVKIEMKAPLAGRALQLAGDALFALIQFVGVAAFAYPLVQPQPPTAEALARSADAPLVLGVTLVAMFALLGVMRINAKRIAVMGVLCAINAVLRLAETLLLPMPGGFSPMFLLIILVGYAYGVRFGFLFGAFSLFTSALATGGVGPWLPFQIFGAGWVGLTAGLLGKLRRPKSSLGSRSPTFDLVLLLPFGFVWGLLYGAILNLYFWPLVDAGAGMSWQAGLGASDALARYAAFYVTTSLWWDVARAIGNVALLLWLGKPILRALQRFGARFQFETAPAFESASQ